MPSLHSPFFIPAPTSFWLTASLVRSVTSSDPLSALSITDPLSPAELEQTLVLKSSSSDRRQDLSLIVTDLIHRLNSQTCFMDLNKFLEPKAANFLCI